MDKSKGNKKLKVAIIQNSDMLKMLYEKLKDHYEIVIQETNGADAIQSLKAIPCDLVIMELLIPGKDGFDVMRHTFDGKKRFVIYSRVWEQSIIKKAIEEGASYYIFKESGMEVDTIKERIDMLYDKNVEHFVYRGGVRGWNLFINSHRARTIGQLTDDVKRKMGYRDFTRSEIMIIIGESRLNVERKLIARMYYADGESFADISREIGRDTKTIKEWMREISAELKNTIPKVFPPHVELA